MTKRSLRTGALLAFLLGAGPAAAGTLTSATWTQVVSPPDNLGFSFSRSTAQLGATGNSTATSIGVSLSVPPFATSFFAPKTPNGIVDLHVRFSQGGSQAISATPGMGSGTAFIPGSLVLMTAPHVATGVNQSMLSVGTKTIVQIPIHVGQVGQFTNTFVILGVGVGFTVDFYAWTPGTLVFTGLTSNYAPRPDVTVMGSFGLTANGGGTVTLVAPAKLSADGSLLSSRSLLSLSTLKLTFVPEPGPLLLLAAGAAALVGRARRRS